MGGGRKCPPFSQKNKDKKSELNYCISIKLYILMTPYHTNRCFSFDAKDCRKVDFKAVGLSTSTKVLLHNFECVLFEF